MLYEKVLDATLAVRSPIHFCAGREAHLLAELRGAFVGRCFKGAYILEVVRVLRASACRLMATNASGGGVVDVQFLASVAVLGKWDILVGVTLVCRDQLLVGQYEAPAPLAAAGAGPGEPPGQGAPRPGLRAAVVLVPSEATKSLALRQRVSVRVSDALHAPMQPQATAVGVLLTCDRAAPVFRLRGALDGAARVELAPLLAAIEAELGARAALAAERRAELWFFERLLYAYRAPAAAGDDQAAAGDDQAVAAWPGGPVWAGPVALRPLGAEPRNLLELARRAADGAVAVDGLWSRPLGLYRSSPLAACAPLDGAPADWPAAVDGAPRAVFAELLKNVLDFLVATRELVGAYATPALVEAHRNVWAAMRAAQAPL